MDRSVRGMSVYEDVNRFHGLKLLSVVPPQSNSSVRTDVSVNDLGEGLSKSLQIQDDWESTSSPIAPEKKGLRNMGKEDLVEEPYQCKSTTSSKCLCKCTTFPSSSKMIPCVALMEDDRGDNKDDIEEGEAEKTTAILAQSGYSEPVKPPYRHSISLPTPLKLKSALKGNREKQGTPPTKLTVTWAPDVYDPPPTAVSHVVTNKTQRYRNDNKKGKNKQKGGSKTLRGSKGKDKKQGRKHGGSLNKCLKLPDNNGRVIDNKAEPYANLVSCGISGPDSYCGGSFLRNSTEKLQFSVAEAS